MRSGSVVALMNLRLVHPDLIKASAGGPNWTLISVFRRRGGKVRGQRHKSTQHIRRPQDVIALAGDARPLEHNLLSAGLRLYTRAYNEGRPVPGQRRVRREGEAR